MVGSDYQELLSETFCRTVPKKYVEESFSVSLFPGMEKIYAVERFVIFLLSKFFCLTEPKKTSYGNTSVFPNFSGIGKFYGQECRGGGVSCFSVSIFLRHSAEKIRRGNLLLFTNFGCRKIFMHKWGMSRFFVRSFLSHSPENLPNGTLLCFRFTPVSKKICG